MARRGLSGAAAIALRSCALAVLCLHLLGCESLFVPVPDAAEAQPAATGETVTSLVRLAVGWEADALAEDLVAAYRAYRPGVTLFPLTMSGASALEAVESGEADLALVAADTKESLQGQAPALQSLLVARDPIAVIVHPGSSLAQAKTADVRALFAGDTLDWSVLESRTGQPALAVQTQGNPARQVFDGVVMQGQPVSSTARVLPDDEAMVVYVASEPFAIGYAAVSHLQEETPVHVVAVDLLLPTRANIEQGEYPLVYGLYAVSRPDRSAFVRGFMSFIQSARGREAVRQRHALP
jgi:phosphate transport system substrate-binding protein